MVRIDRIVTRGGDRGKTSLGDGTRVRKDTARIGAIGAVDEANAAIGVLRAEPGLGPDVAAALARIQNDLFDLGADLCVPEAGKKDRPRFADAQVERLEAEIAAMNAGIPPLRSFILPGGSRAAALAHVARATVRRAEREVVRLASEEELTGAVPRYLNRLSDHLFVVARVLNNRGADDVTWVPGASRPGAV